MGSNQRIYAKIDLDAVRFNLKSIEGILAEQASVLAVVKADGYGHGAQQIAKAIEEERRLFGFAVATVQEALDLRKGGVKKPILILGYVFEEDYEELIRENIRLTVYSYEMAEQISEAAGRIGTDAYLHIKIDTGMGRLGYRPTEESAGEIKRTAALSHIVAEGIFTHFARADEADKSFAKAQLKQFLSFCELLVQRGISIPLRHCANSAAIAGLPEAGLNLVRAGIVLYGLAPSEEIRQELPALKPVMEIKSRIVHLKMLEAGRSISYGGTYQLKEPRKIATIPVGYADGWPRSLSNRGYVLIRGQKAPILGRICMDQMMADVTDIDGVRLLDLVTLLGESCGQHLSMEELARLSGRFNYEFACCIGKRVPRIYYSGG